MTAHSPSGERKYIAIDLKSFYASVECVERGLDPLTTNLVVADVSRTEKTICLAVSPSLKRHGIGGRARLFEVVQRVREVNRERATRAPGGRLYGRSYLAAELDSHPEYAVDYLVAPPRMARYIEVSTRIYDVYLRYVAPEDIHVYSIDEVFIDATSYLDIYGLSAHDFAMKMIRDVLRATGITATAGIGTNLYLCKIAMDIVAKKMKPDADGVRVAELDEMTYRSQLWDHTPLTDFWRVGKGTARRLRAYGMVTMGDIARMSVRSDEFLYRLFGVNAELLIDHAWGWEPVTIADIKAYRPRSRCLSSGQVLQEPYTAEKARIVIQEMADGAALNLLDKRMVAGRFELHVGYDVESLKDPEIAAAYDGPIVRDHYGRRVPYHARGTGNFERPTSSATQFRAAVARLFDRIVNPSLLIRRLTLMLAQLEDETDYESRRPRAVQMSLFDDVDAAMERSQREKRERRLQETVLKIKKSYGKNSILSGLNYAEGATQRDRNRQIGGHHE